MGKERFEQWLYNIACIEVKHFHGNNGIFSSEEYRLECSERKQLQSFSGVGVQHQNSKAEQAIQNYYVYGSHLSGAFKFTLDGHGG
jgi:transposase InsO family protein